jgi:DNA-binding beta-propeller fold protein YncE
MRRPRSARRPTATHLTAALLAATLCVVATLSLGACRGATLAGTARSSALPARGPQGGVLVVANQQSASATLVTLPGGEVRHVTVGAGPHEAAVGAHGQWAVVSVYGTREETGTRLALLDLAAGALVRHVALGGYTRPHGVVALPGAGRRVVVTSEASQRLLVVDLERDTVLAAIPTGAAGSPMVAVTRDGTRAFTANVGSGSVSEIDLVAGRLVRQIPTGPVTEGLAVTPDAREVWAGSNQARTISVIDTRAGRVVATLAGVGVPYRIAISPDGRTAAVADPEGDAVHVVDVAARRAVGAVTGIGSPRGVTFSPDSRTVFATLGTEGAVAVLDLPSRTAVGRHAVGAAPDGVAFAPAPR